MTVSMNVSTNCEHLIAICYCPVWCVGCEECNFQESEVSSWSLAGCSLPGQLNGLNGAQEKWTACIASCSTQKWSPPYFFVTHAVNAFWEISKKNIQLVCDTWFTWQLPHASSLNPHKRTLLSVDTTTDNDNHQCLQQQSHFIGSAPCTRATPTAIRC